MTRLIEILARRQSQFDKDPFEPVSIVVQSIGMGQWLKFKLAEDQGIAANIDCMLPASLIWRLYQSLLQEENLPDTSPFDRELLAWRLMRLLPEQDGPEFASIQQYLQGTGDPQLRLYQLCQQIAGLFDEYLIYRPQWMIAWEHGESHISEEIMRDQTWQMALWQSLLAQPDLAATHHRAHLHKALQERLEDPEDIPRSVPQHLSIFGLSSLPPMHLDTFRMLGNLIAVDIYFLNPCEHYWGDIISQKDMARKTIRELKDKDGPLTDEDYLEIGNPLLSSMGKQGREFLELLLALDNAESQETFVRSDPECMLGFLKNDILHLEFGGQFASNTAPEPRTVQTADYSIQIHSCHSKMREVEVLYDQLHRIFEDNDDIKPRNVMVMMPNVADYAPYIHAVFKDIPYSIADRSPGEESPVLMSFWSLIGLPQSRLTANEVMDLLETPAIARRFNLDDNDLATLTARINEAGIRFELDGAAKRANWDLPSTDQNTWAFGLRRLMAGYALENRQGLYRDILPVDLEGHEARLAGILNHFVTLLARYRAKFSRAKPANEWLDTISNMINEIYAPFGDEEFHLNVIRDALQSFVAQTEKTEFMEPVSPDVFRHWMAEHIDESDSGGAFLSGGITFATLIPMRSIPFEVICLLGMNDNEYPRRSRTVDFDLIQLEGEKKGDRSRRNDDRYLFLEALLSANRYFYLSYEGRSLKDNSEKVPSVLVNELKEYCQAVFDIDCQTQHPLQPFNQDYFDPEKPALFTWRTEWYRALTNKQPKKAFISEALSPAEEFPRIDIEDLMHFYRHPARYFMRQRLGIYFEDNEIELEDSEPFSLDALEKHHLADSALTHIMQGKPGDEWQQLMTASGTVMDNPTGQQQLEEEYANAYTVFEKLADYVDREPKAIATEVEIEGMQIQGQIDNIYGDILLNYRTGKLRRRQLMQCWLQHCFLNATGHHVRTTMISSENPVNLSPLAVSDAQQILARLVQHFHLGLRKPLPFIPEMSFTYAVALHNGRDPDVAGKEALKSWLSGRAGTEGMDRNYQRCFDFPEALDQAFHEAAITIAGPVLEAVSE